MNEETFAMVPKGRLEALEGEVAQLRTRVEALEAAGQAAEDAARELLEEPGAIEADFGAYRRRSERRRQEEGP